MATMYYLLFGLLFTAVCGTVGTGNGVVVLSSEYWVLRLSKKPVIPTGARYVVQWRDLKTKQDGAVVLGSEYWILRREESKEQRSKNKDGREHEKERERIVRIATAELGVREATSKNDGPRVEGYLRYTGLDKGHAWCAAFVSWCFGQVGRPEPRNPWSPALFPKARTYWQRNDTPPLGVGGIKPADLFGTYGTKAKRINHVGLVKKMENKYLITIEGNSNNRVESRRRHLSTIYALADWISGE